MTEAQRKWQDARRDRQAAAGFCRRCDKPRNGGVLCREHQDEANASARANYELRKTKNICPGCCGEKLPEWTGVYCPTCQESKLAGVLKGYRRLKPSEKKRRSEKHRETARARGTCVHCGKPAQPERLRCRSCQVDVSTRSEEIRDWRRANGLCFTCGDACDGGFKSCAACRSKVRARYAKATRARAVASAASVAIESEAV